MKISRLVSFSLFLSIFCSPLVAQTTDDDYEKLLSESPFNEMYPRVIAEDAAEYFGEFNMLFSKGPIAPKEAMKLPKLREHLLNDTIYIASNLTFSNLSPLSGFLGKPGNVNLGGMPFDEYIERQRQHR